MGSGVLAGRGLRASLAAALALGLGGCTQAAGTGSSVVATGRNLTVYLSAPAASASDPVARDVLAAETMAFDQKASEVTAFRLSLARATSSKLSDNARTAISNTAAIAYLGEIVPGASSDSLGITNAEQLLQVSPTDTAVALTRATSAVPGAPASYLEALKTFGRTFARVVPTTDQEARVLVAAMVRDKVRSVYVADDGSDYGRALAAALRADAGGIQVMSGAAQPGAYAASGAQALFFATASPTAARQLFTAAAARRPGARIFAPSALADPAFAASLGTPRLDLTVTAPGVASRGGNPAAQAFTRSFQRAEHRAPLPQAVFGYEAMSSVLDTLKQAGATANNRSVVVHDFLALRNRASPLGSYSIDANGDTSLSTFVLERLQGGKLVTAP